MPDGSPDDLFVEALQQMGAVTFEQLEAARMEQARQAEQGNRASLPDLLVQQGVITPLLRENVEKKLCAQKTGGIRQLGPYRLVKKLGEGGMGAVFLAEDTQMGRPCAVKVLPRQYSSKREFLTRFHREAVATGKLSHPNIVMAYTVGEELGVHYYAMEYCDGAPLDAVLKRTGSVPWQVAVDVVVQVAGGLQHAHEHGIIHRDIKPANVFICRPPGSPASSAASDAFPKGFIAKILDLGLSKTISGDAESSFLTQTGLTLGTPHYISPEQASGEKDIDGRTDIYSLGATFYHLVTGQTPFSGSTAAAVIMKHMREQLRSPKDLNPAVPDGVCLVIQRMMAKQADNRYPDCAELLADLELLNAGQMPTPWDGDAQSSVVAQPLAATIEMQKASTRPATTMASVVPSIPATQLTSVTPPESKVFGLNRLQLVAGVGIAVLLFLLLLIWAFSSGGSSITEDVKRAAELRFQQEQERARAAAEEVERAKRDAELRIRQAERAAEDLKRASEAAQGAKLGELEQQILREREQGEQTKRQLEDARRQVEEAKRQAEQKDTPPDTKQNDVEKADPPKVPDTPVPVDVEQTVQEERRRQNDAVLTALEKWSVSVIDDPRPAEPRDLPKVAAVDDVEGLKRLHVLLARRCFDAQEAEGRALNNETPIKLRINAIQRRLNAPERPQPGPDGRPPLSRPAPPVFDERKWREREVDQQQLRTLNDQAEEARNETARVGQAAKALLATKQAVGDRLRALGVQDLTAGPTSPRKDAAYKIYVMKDGTELKAYMAVKMGEEIAIRDEQGKTQTIRASDVREVRNGP